MLAQGHGFDIMSLLKQNTETRIKLCSTLKTFGSKQKTQLVTLN